MAKRNWKKCPGPSAGGPRYIGVSTVAKCGKKLSIKKGHAICYTCEQKRRRMVNA